MLGDADMKRARLGLQGANLHEMVFGATRVASANAAVLGVAAAATAVSHAARFLLLHVDSVCLFHLTPLFLKHHA